MAELKVERKQPSIWPWILGLLVLVLAIFVVVQVTRRDRREDGREGRPADVHAPNPEPADHPANP